MRCHYENSLCEATNAIEWFPGHLTMTCFHKDETLRAISSPNTKMLFHEIRAILKPHIMPYKPPTPQSPPMFQ